MMSPVFFAFTFGRANTMPLDPPVMTAVLPEAAPWGVPLQFCTKWSVICYTGAGEFVPAYISVLVDR
jgi:hypothetical protein